MHAWNFVLLCAWHILYGMQSRYLRVYSVLMNKHKINVCIQLSSSMGVWCNGSMLCSKGSGLGSIPGAPSSFSFLSFPINTITSTALVYAWNHRSNQCLSVYCSISHSYHHRLILLLSRSILFLFDILGVKALSHILDVVFSKTFSPDKSLRQKFSKIQHLRCETGPFLSRFMVQQVPRDGPNQIE